MKERSEKSSIGKNISRNRDRKTNERDLRELEG